MMQLAEPWHGNNPMTSAGILFCQTSSGCSFAQGKMSSVLVIVPNIFGHQAFQMTLIQNNYMVEQIPTTITNPALSNAVLPRTPEAGSFGLEVQCLDGTDDLSIVEVRGPVKDQVFPGRNRRGTLPAAAA